MVQPTWAKIAQREDGVRTFVTPYGVTCQGINQRGELKSGKGSSRHRRRYKIYNVELLSTAKVEPFHVKDGKDIDKGIDFIMGSFEAINLQAVQSVSDEIAPIEDTSDSEVEEGEVVERVMPPRMHKKQKVMHEEDEDDVVKAETNESEEVRVLAGKSKLPIIGISLPISESSRKVPMGSIVYIHLSTLNRACTINVPACLSTPSGISAFMNSKLRQFLVSKEISLHGFYAASIASRLYTWLPILTRQVAEADQRPPKLPFPIRLRNMSTVLQENEIRDLLELCHICLDKTDLEDKLDPFFGKAKLDGEEKDNLTPWATLINHMREAYLCAALAHACPETEVISTINVDNDFIKAVEKEARAFDLGNIVEKGKAKVNYNRMIPRPARMDENGKYHPAHLEIFFNRLSDMPQPSRTRLMYFELEYYYYSQRDEWVGSPETGHIVREGFRVPGVWAEMIGQVYARKERSVLVRFPKGVRVEDGYNVIPHNVYMKSDFKEEDAELFYEPLDVEKNTRMNIVNITMRGVPEPSPQYLQMFQHIRGLLRDNSK